MAFCKNCGAELGAGDKFCPDCGTAVEMSPVNAAKNPPAKEGFLDKLFSFKGRLAKKQYAKLGFVSHIATIALIILKGEPNDNKYGSVPA